MKTNENCIKIKIIVKDVFDCREKEKKIRFNINKNHILRSLSNEYKRLEKRCKCNNFTVLPTIKYHSVVDTVSMTTSVEFTGVV